MKKRDRAGVDEAGRGPLAGPVLAACVQFPSSIPGVKDSKKLTPSGRVKLFHKIFHHSAWMCFALVGETFIDQYNILNASLLAMECCMRLTKGKAKKFLVDGPYAPRGFERCCQPVVGGDQKVPEIGAASVVAKVLRDRVMKDYSLLFSKWSFSLHKGYPTPAHFSEIKKFGISSIHRKTFCKEPQEK
ncbi:MAG: ribonuclease HII [bacterium JZ-2024 1]